MTTTIPATVECPTCRGGGELVECANDGKAGCSHTNDREYPCPTCRGEGECTASQRMGAAADVLDVQREAYAEPLAELLRREAMHAADLEAASTTWDRYPADTALLVQVADGVLAANRV